MIKRILILAMITSTGTLCAACDLSGGGVGCSAEYRVQVATKKTPKTKVSTVRTRSDHGYVGEIECATEEPSESVGVDTSPTP